MPVNCSVDSPTQIMHVILLGWGCLFFHQHCYHKSNMNLLTTRRPNSVVHGRSSITTRGSISSWPLKVIRCQLRHSTVGSYPKIWKTAIHVYIHDNSSASHNYLEWKMIMMSLFLLTFGNWVIKFSNVYPIHWFLMQLTSCTGFSQCSDVTSPWHPSLEIHQYKNVHACAGFFCGPPGLVTPSPPWVFGQKEDFRSRQP